MKISNAILYTGASIAIAQGVIAVTKEIKRRREQWDNGVFDRARAMAKEVGGKLVFVSWNYGPHTCKKCNKPIECEISFPWRHGFGPYWGVGRIGMCMDCRLILVECEKKPEGTNMYNLPQKDFLFWIDLRKNLK